MHAIESDNMSAKIEGNEFPEGKYAWNLGCCQCVTCINLKRLYFFVSDCEPIHKLCLNLKTLSH